MVEQLFGTPMYPQASVQEAQEISAPSQAPVQDVTGVQDNIEPSQVVTPHYVPSYNNFYVRRKRADKQKEVQAPERRYPQREHRAPNLFTFD